MVALHGRRGARECHGGRVISMDLPQAPWQQRYWLEAETLKMEKEGGRRRRFRPRNQVSTEELQCDSLKSRVSRLSNQPKLKKCRNEIILGEK
jgi:hypothetical protein